MTDWPSLCRAPVPRQALVSARVEEWAIILAVLSASAKRLSLRSSFRLSSSSSAELSAPLSKTAISDLLDACMGVDRPVLARALSRLRASVIPDDLRARIERSVARRAQRHAARPRPRFPEELPVNQKREEIARAIEASQVVIVCGETGSGKTTQLPKICLELGRGCAGLIGHTQPRRIAARATATRIAQELDSPLGEAVGYKIRFTDRVSESSYLKLMTDGMLLAETQGDPLLSAYDTLIIDEAHERSLNIDFLLGYLRQLLVKRPELKLIVTSATLDADRFAQHFAAGAEPAPVIEVSGRLYPIDMRWRPLDKDGGRSAKDRDITEAIVDAVDEAFAIGPGDALVFLPGEREIREAAEALRKHHFARGAVEILPLFARQSVQEQGRVFAPHQGRRVVLATNVAETSLTVPGIRYVIDSGLARVKRYSHRNKVEQLQIEPIAQSAARQRAGRCGRVASGVCLRLYAEDDYARRPAHTDPEILRSSLAGVILRMGSLGLGEVGDFPFLDRPPPRMVADGYQLLNELGAVDEDRALTPLGRELAKLPLDPKIGRMILAAREQGALRELLIIAAALSVQDPRERPQEAAGSADQAHAKFRGPEAEQRSEFLWFLRAWAAFDEQWTHQTQRKQRDWCRQHFLNYLRMREWRDVHAQLHVLAAEHGWRENEEPATYEAIHKALLAGLLGNIGVKADEDQHYLGARGIKWYPHPGSALAKKAGKWVMAAELVETTRLYARCLAKVEPEWVEQVGAHLVKRHVFEPHWSKGSGHVVAFERATLYGIVLHARRPVAYSRIDPAQCREIFIREGLARGELPDDVARRAPFFQHNRKLVAEIERLEHKTRRPDVLVDEELIHAFYDAILPAGIIDVRAFEAWRREAEAKQPKLLFLERDQLMRHEAAGVTTDRFPAGFELHGQQLKLSYQHDPGAADDGVTLSVPLALVNQVPAARCEWLVPGMLEDKINQLARSVPQKIRHRLQPIREFAQDFCARAEAGEFDLEQPLLRVLARDIEERVSLKLPLESIRGENLPAHLAMNFRVIDEHGRILGQSRNLAELRARYARDVQQRFEQASVALPARPMSGEPISTRVSGQVSGAAAVAAGAPADAIAGTLSGLTTWSFGALPEIMAVTIAGREVIGFPALVDEGASVGLRVFDTPDKARAAHHAGLRRLFALELREQVKFIEKSLPGLRDMGMLFMQLGIEAELKAQLVDATLDRTCMLEPLPQDAASFARRVQEARPRITLVAQELARLAMSTLTEHAALLKKLATIKALPQVVEDIRAQCAGLVGRRFVAELPFERLQQLPRYLKAASLRIDKLRADPARDGRLLAEWKSLAAPFERERSQRARSGVADPQLDEFRWLLEELRVALFAQELRTPMPISVKRLQKIWESRTHG
ncbi:MAG: ATP-dependent RNA helicase HrpA [Sterolibacteriaceae bacterium]|uniref:ATP-dependent RNA helicase HrpA n=1 Tax=Candidatus Methylophosphatis roskildensis TaxID=2899263 RepID=A0A9D7E7A8_9PROT|nr:ATP-dependent RNA helicase HrpA [Candidatus Methylophosphatis roskildensis]